MVAQRLTQTKMRNFKNCHRFFYYRHEQLLVPRAQRAGQRRGGNLGTVLFRIQQEEVGQDYLRSFVTFVVEELYENAHPSSTAEQREIEIEKVKLIEVALAYIDTYGIDRKREIVYDLPLINPNTGRAMHAFRSSGKIDGLIPLGNKHAKIIEDKFVKQIQRAQIEKLPLDDQLTEYVDALAREGWTAEVEFRHTRYPGINPNPPKQFKKKDDYPGETLEEFAIRLATDLVDRHSFYFDVQNLRFSTEHLEEFRLHRWMVAKEILEKRAQAKKLGIGAWYKNPSHCSDWGGCQFIPLCCGIEGAEHMYEVSNSQDPELETGASENGDTEDSTDE